MFHLSLGDHDTLLGHGMLIYLFIFGGFIGAMFDSLLFLDVTGKLCFLLFEYELSIYKIKYVYLLTRYLFSQEFLPLCY